MQARRPGSTSQAASALNERVARAQICAIGRRLYARGFAAASDGNLSCRVRRRGKEVVVCTPTLICKGFMKSTDLCVVDLDGRRLAGRRTPTSELPLHLELYRADPAIQAVVHCHPPHATAFGIAGVDIPTGILPEVEIFLGVVPRAPYETPGSPEFARTVLPFVGRANTVVLSNHGTVSWADNLERAYWQTEILDAYCRILLLARQLGRVGRLPEDKLCELLQLKERFGAGADPRQNDPSDLFINPDFGGPPRPISYSGG